MKNRFYFWLAACSVLLLGISFSLPAKSDAAGNPYTTSDKEYYLTEDLWALAKPGVNFTLIDLEIPDDLRPEVTFSLMDDFGRPLDRNGMFTPGTIDVRFMFTYIPEGEENWVSYHERFRDPGYRPAPPEANDAFTYVGDGVYTYKFVDALPADYDEDATHKLASTARRDLRDFEEFGLGRYADNDVYIYVPSGAGEPMPRDIATTETCNGRCHDPLAMHGGTYQEVQVCTSCHNPDQLGGDGDELSYEFSAVIHRVHSNQEPELDEDVHYPAVLNDCQVCHTGGTPQAPRDDLDNDGMPLVAGPNPAPSCDGSGLGMTTVSWADVGSPVEIRLNAKNGKVFAKSNGGGSKETGNWLKDGTNFFMVGADGEFIDEQKVNLTVYGCADNPPYDYGAYGVAGSMHANWMTNPNREACGGCHTYIDWETGENHGGGAQEDDSLCSFCHEADTGEEFDWGSVKGVHTLPLASEVLEGVYVNIKSVTNTGPGQRPTVLFSVTGKSGPVDPSTLDRLLFTLVGPNDDFEFYAQENVIGSLIAVGGDWSYTFATRVPANATGSYSVGFEGRITTEVNGEDERDSAENYIVPIAVTDAEAEARRMIVDDAKCEACHSNLSLHGDNRKNASMYCQTCHRPDATDVNRRLEGLPESVHFKYMIHKIHRGAGLANKPYIIYGYGNSVHDYSEVHFPARLNNCENCHVDDTYELPIAEGALPTTTPNQPITEMQPITATCLSCHDSDSTVAHADANTSDDFGESCEACHGEGKSYAVSKVHAD